MAPALRRGLIGSMWTNVARNFDGKSVRAAPSRSGAARMEDPKQRIDPKRFNGGAGAALEGCSREDDREENRLPRDAEFRGIHGRDHSLVHRPDGAASVSDDGHLPGRRRDDHHRLRFRTARTTTGRRPTPRAASRGSWATSISPRSRIRARTTPNSRSGCSRSGRGRPSVGWSVRRSPSPSPKHVVKNLPGATFVDATDWLDEIRVPKSAEEIELVKCRRLAPGCLPGRTEAHHRSRQARRRHLR